MWDKYLFRWEVLKIHWHIAGTEWTKGRVELGRNTPYWRTLVPLVQYNEVSTNETFRIILVTDYIYTLANTLWHIILHSPIDYMHTPQKLDQEELKLNVCEYWWKCDGCYTCMTTGHLRNHAIASLQWRHNGRDGFSNHQPHHCLLNRLFKAQIKEKIKAPRHWPLCGEFTGDRWISRTNGQ